MGTAQSQREWQGAALWSRGFRPFFLGAGLWAATAIAIWPPLFTGEISVPTAFSPVDWHVHEMIFGYGAAVIAGFLLTAIPNWTGRLPVAGPPLAVLALLWAIGRAAIFVSAVIGPVSAAAIDVAFLAIFTIVIAREVLASSNTRNIKVVTIVLVLTFANAAFHVEAISGGRAEYATRAGLGGIIMLILVIGGRVVPSFTHNWLARRGDTARPAPFGKEDAALMALSGAALILWVVAPDTGVGGVCLLAAGLANLWRLSRWRGWTTRADPLVFVLHAGFFFAASGFLFAGLHGLRGDHVPSAVAVHIWGIGGIGIMTLAMMTRATLGHTGQPLRASPGTTLAYCLVVFAMVVRVAMAFAPSHFVPCLYVAAVAWVAGFGMFLVDYASKLVRARV